MGGTLGFSGLGYRVSLLRNLGALGPENTCDPKP